jgi:hydroxymethylpyrimidine pyrophosphatase-like HAD family hydrolase
VSFLNRELPLNRIEAEFRGSLNVIPATVAAWGPNSGELSLPGVHKAAAIELVIDHLGIPIENTIAFGDGLNDIEMLQLVAVGVAMGGAHPLTLAAADEVTGTPDTDGILAGFIKHGLVDPDP